MLVFPLQTSVSRRICTDVGNATSTTSELPPWQALWNKRFKEIPYFCLSVIYFQSISNYKTLLDAVEAETGHTVPTR